MSGFRDGKNFNNNFKPNNNYNYDKNKNLNNQSIQNNQNNNQYQFKKNQNYQNNHNNQNNQNYQNNYNNQNNQNDNNIKTHLLDFLYNKIEVGEHRYTVIKNIGDVYDLKSKKHYLSANSCGINSILIFMKKDGDHLSYLIDRRSISYNRQSLNKSAVRITEIKLAVDLKLYEGTILDGIIIDSDSNIIGNTITSNKLENDNNESLTSKLNFMVTDIFMLGGKSLNTMDYKKKMYLGSFMFEKLISNKDKSNNIVMHVSHPYELNEIKTLFNEHIASNIKNHNIKGITFYPQFSGTKLIYIFDKQDDKYKSELLEGSAEINLIGSTNDQEDNFEYSDKKRIFKFELVDPECIDDIVLNLEMKKTDIPDVYKLFGIFVNKQVKPTQHIKKKIGYAYIPTYILSIKCKLYFLNRDSVIMSCLFNTNKNKWIPIDEAQIQKIDILNEEKRLKITEQEIEIEDNEFVNTNKQDE
jgi:hypothetical protein